MRNIFIEGCSGSGKDTLANFFESRDYKKIRIADTIKRIICEMKNLTFEELEEQKRINPELRLLHNFWGKILDSDNGTNNRISQIINGTALDLCRNNSPLCVCDCRGYDNVMQFLNVGFIGIFLSRNINEYGNPDHWTESTIIKTNSLLQIPLHLRGNCIIVFNDYYENSEIITRLNEQHFHCMDLTGEKSKDAPTFIENFESKLKQYSNIIK